MKKVVAIFVLALGFVTSIQAQKGKKGNFEKMTSEQRTELHLKKMTLALDLTSSQASQIKPLLLEKANKRKAMHEKRKSLKESGKKPTADERYAIKSAKLDKMIAFKADMKRILNEKQYEKFEKMVAHKAHKMKRKMHKRGKKRHQHRDEDRG